MPICEELDIELRRWLTHYGTEVGHELQDHYYLLPARVSSGLILNGRGKIHGHHTFYQPTKPVGAMSRIVKPFLEELGVPLETPGGKKTYEGAHTIRRSGARALFDVLAADGGYDHPMRVVQAMLHHSQMSTTETYLGLTADRRTRDEMLRGKRMYGSLHESSVISLAR